MGSDFKRRTEIRQMVSHNDAGLFHRLSRIIVRAMTYGALFHDSSLRLNGFLFFIRLAYKGHNVVNLIRGVKHRTLPIQGNLSYFRTF